MKRAERPYPDDQRAGRTGQAVSRRAFFRRLTAGGAALAAVPFANDRLPSTQRDEMLGGKGVGAGGLSSRGFPRRQTELFNGRDLSGWDSFLVEEGVGTEDVWSVEEGILICKGEPNGYLYTREDYESFELVVEWRWPEEPGNSGVLMRIAGEPAMLPSCVEAQLRSGSAGDMYGFQGFRIGGDPNRLSEISIGWSLPRIAGNESEPGEWNRYEITADGDRISVVLNGMLVNEATDCEVRPGRIGLQSEGGVVHFRTVALTTL
jgi:hypothetical protein